MAVTVKREVEFTSETASLNEIRSFVRETLESAAIPDPTAKLVVLAVDEAVTSIVRHARADHRSGMVQVAIDIDDVRIRVAIVDSTNHFEQGLPPREEWRRFLEGRRTLEMGVFLIRKIMDEIEYVYRRGFENQLVLVKFLC